MDRATALPTGTDRFEENSASRSRGFDLPSRAAIGTTYFALNRKQRMGANRIPESDMFSATKLAVAVNDAIKGYDPA
jgi:hypothetical protein